jgi:hypothetical protein
VVWRSSYGARCGQDQGGHAGVLRYVGDESRTAVLITISRLDSADGAFANEKAADWVRNNVLEFTKGMPEVMIGNTLIAEVK